MSGNYVDRAKNVIAKLKVGPRGEIKLTTSQIRKILSEVNKINNRIEVFSATGRIKDNTLPDEILSDIQALKVKIIYQCGKDQKNKEKNVIKFVNEADLIGELDRVGKSRKAFERFYSYIEALVAYHRYEGGK